MAIPGCGTPAPRPPEPPRSLGSLAPEASEERALGPATEVCVLGETVLACREDGALTWASSTGRGRIAPPPEAVFRHVAAGGGRALAVTNRGIVHEVDVASGTTRAIEGRTQGIAHLAVGPDGVGYVGIEGGALFRVPRDAKAVETLWESGAEPVAALAADENRVFVAHADGTIAWTPEGPTSKATLLPDIPAVMALAADARGIAIGVAGGFVRWSSLPRGATVLGAPEVVELNGPVRALSMLPGYVIVLLRPSRIELLRLPKLERVGAVALPGLEVRAIATDPSGRRLWLATSGAAGVRELPILGEPATATEGR